LKPHNYLLVFYFFPIKDSSV